MTNKGHHLCHPGKIRYLLSHEVDAGQSIVHRLHQGMSTMLTQGMGAEHKDQLLLKWHMKSNGNK